MRFTLSGMAHYIDMPSVKILIQHINGIMICGGGNVDLNQLTTILWAFERESSQFDVAWEDRLNNIQRLCGA